MKRPTSWRRLLLAVAAGAALPPLVFRLMTAAALPSGTRLDGNLERVGVTWFDQLVHVLEGPFDALVFGGPICLAVIALFAPVWALHHHLRGGLFSFLLAAAAVGALPFAALAWFGSAFLPALAKHAIEGAPIFIGLVALGGGLLTLPSALAMWFIAYGGEGGRSYGPAAPAR